MNTRLFTFIGGETGAWRITRMETITGDSIPAASRLESIPGRVTEQPQGTQWLFHGITSNERYVVREEKNHLVAKQPKLGRSQARCAALIPVRKSASWWASKDI